MWTYVLRFFVLVIILLWQPIQFLLFAYRVLFKNDKKMFEIAYAYDVVANTTLNGDRGETISSRVGYAYLNGRRYAKVLAPLIDSIFGANHCVEAAYAFHPTLKLIKRVHISDFS